MVAAMERLRAEVPRVTHDRVLSGDIERVAGMIQAGEFTLPDFAPQA